MGSRPVRAAGFVLYRREGPERRYLILFDARDGHPSLPKGLLEPGETPLEGACRELEEETGWTKEQIRSVPGFRRRVVYRLPDAPPPGSWKEVTYFLAELRPDAPPLRLSAEHAAGSWFPLEEAAGRLAHPTLRHLLQEADRFLEEREA